MPQKSLKTQKTVLDPKVFIAGIPDVGKRRDAQTLLKLMEEATGKKAAMWGSSIVGFGEYVYARKDGSKHVFAAVGFSPRAQNMALYGLLLGRTGEDALLEKLGPHTRGKGCLYLRGLEGTHVPTLKKLISKGYAGMMAWKG